MKKSQRKKISSKIKKILFRYKKAFFLMGITIVASIVLIAFHATAQTQFPQRPGVNVRATVGSVSLTITGYQSPYASIILKTSSGTFLASTTADATGYFSFTDVLINNSELTYCFQAVDFKRIGLSESCITIPGPITSNIVYSDVFLPPTIGLSKKTINAGQDAVVYGYSMPGAKVTITINGTLQTITTDNTGFYSYTYKNVPPGIFTITANASLDDQLSIEPTNKVVLESLSVPQQITDKGEEVIKEIVDKTKDTVPFNLLPYLLTALALLVAIGILLYKLKLKPWMFLIDRLRHKKKMHHDWFFDKW